jgi:hypothetical protein
VTGKEEIDDIDPCVRTTPCFAQIVHSTHMHNANAQFMCQFASACVSVGVDPEKIATAWRTPDVVAERQRRDLHCYLPLIRWSQRSQSS